MFCRVPPVLLLSSLSPFPCLSVPRSEASDPTNRFGEALLAAAADAAVVVVIFTALHGMQTRSSDETDGRTECHHGGIVLISFAMYLFFACCFLVCLFF